MNKLLTSLFAAACVMQSLAAPFAIQIKDGRPDALYKAGEKCRFTLTARDMATNEVSRGGTIRVTMDNFGGRKLSEREWNPSVEPVLTLEGTLNEPGFLRVKAISAPRPSGALWALGKNNLCWSVGYDVYKIAPGSPRPGDFDAYWDGERSRLAREVPLDARMELLEWKCDDGYDVWKLSFATFGGKRVWGFMTRPKNTKDAKLPLYINIPGAGPALSEDGTQSFKKPGEIHMVLNVHPFEPAKDAQGQKKLYNEQDAACAKKYRCNYAIAGVAKSREEFFFHDALLGIDRAVTWAASLPYVDTSRVRYSGGSQGGGMGIALCALNPAVKKAYFLVPALADLCGFAAGRQSGWPLAVERQKNDADKAAARQVVPYFDAAHFAPRVKIPVRMSVGFSDTTCPPHCVYAAFNALGSTDREICNGLGMGHSTYPEIRQKLEKWLHADNAAGK